MNKSVHAQILYLANLLVLPGVSFVLLAMQYRTLVWQRSKEPV